MRPALYRTRGQWRMRQLFRSAVFGFGQAMTYLEVVRSDGAAWRVHCFDGGVFIGSMGFPSAGSALRSLTRGAQLLAVEA
jgi:hypothetical protein